MIKKEHSYSCSSIMFFLELKFIPDFLCMNDLDILFKIKQTQLHRFENNLRDQIFEIQSNNT